MITPYDTALTAEWLDEIERRLDCTARGETVAAPPMPILRELVAAARRDIQQRAAIEATTPASEGAP